MFAAAALLIPSWLASQQIEASQRNKTEVVTRLRVIILSQLNENKSVCET